MRYTPRYDRYEVLWDFWRLDRRFAQTISRTVSSVEHRTANFHESKWGLWPKIDKLFSKVIADTSQGSKFWKRSAMALMLTWEKDDQIWSPQVWTRWHKNTAAKFLPFPKTQPVACKLVPTKNALRRFSQDRMCCKSAVSHWRTTVMTQMTMVSLWGIGLVPHR